MSILGTIGNIALQILPFAPTMAKALQTGGSAGDKAMALLQAFLGGVRKTPEEIELILAQTDAQKLVELRKIEAEFIVEMVKSGNQLAMAHLQFDKEMFKKKNSFFFIGPRYLAMWMSLLLLLMFNSLIFAPTLMALCNLVFGLGIPLEDIRAIQTMADGMSGNAVIADMFVLLGIGGYKTIEKFRGVHRDGF